MDLPVLNIITTLLEKERAYKLSKPHLDEVNQLFLAKFHVHDPQNITLRYLGCLAIVYMILTVCAFVGLSPLYISSHPIPQGDFFLLEVPIGDPCSFLTKTTICYHAKDICRTCSPPRQDCICNSVIFGHTYTEIVIDVIVVVACLLCPIFLTIILAVAYHYIGSKIIGLITDRQVARQLKYIDRILLIFSIIEDDYITLATRNKIKEYIETNISPRKEIIDEITSILSIKSSSDPIQKRHGNLQIEIKSDDISRKLYVVLADSHLITYPYFQAFSQFDGSGLSITIPPVTSRDACIALLHFINEDGLIDPSYATPAMGRGSEDNMLDLMYAAEAFTIKGCVGYCLMNLRTSTLDFLLSWSQEMTTTTTTVTSQGSEVIIVWHVKNGIR